MSDNSIQVAPAGADAAGAPAPEPGSTAAPEDAITQAPAGGEETPQEPVKTFTQEEVNRIAKKEADQAYRRAKREAQEAAEKPQPVSIGEAPNPADFDNALDYADALAEHKAAVIVAQREHQKTLAQTNSTFRDRVEQARDKYTDFDAVALNDDLVISPAMGKVIKTSDVGTDIAYYLGTNPKEAERIAALDVLDQAVEMGKLVAKMTSTTSTTPAKKTTTAPAPITPVGSGSTTPVLDPLDPRSTKSMTPKQWIDARNAQEAAQRQ